MAEAITLGKYDVYADEKHKVGKGAQGDVYTGVDKSTPDLPTVAAKKATICKEFLDNGEFKREADLLLHKIPPHENIIKVLEFLKIDSQKDDGMLDVWLVMEYCELGNLQSYAYKHELSVKDKFELIFQMALAVNHLHNCKPESVTHRDIKPQNVLLTGNEESPTVKLADFGLARTVARNEKGQSVIMVSRAGTPDYMAPEQIELQDGNFKYSKMIDIFSLAVTWLALLEVRKGKHMAAKTGNCITFSLSPLASFFFLPFHISLSFSVFHFIVHLFTTVR